MRYLVPVSHAAHAVGVGVWEISPTVDDPAHAARVVAADHGLVVGVDVDLLTEHEFVFRQLLAEVPADPPV